MLYEVITEEGTVYPGLYPIISAQAATDVLVFDATANGSIDSLVV